ncbi:MAG: hypothetical protein ACREQ5_04730 [Candidatus Dormibacteria bacterium]
MTAELRPLTTNFNDGQNLIIDPYTGTIVNTPILISGFLVGYKDPAIYTLTLPFIDQLLVGSLPLMAPFTAYYLITETYNTNLFLAHPGATDPFVVTRKIRPFTAGGPNQSVSAILV